jgi:hypothetical protein
MAFNECGSISKLIKEITFSSTLNTHVSSFEKICYILLFSGNFSWCGSTLWFLLFLFILKMIVLWYIAPYSLAGVDRCFRHAYCIHYQGDDRPDDGRSMHVWNVDLLQRDYTALYPRRLIFILDAMRTSNLTCACFISQDVFCVIADMWFLVL